jgi:hypothetical protein
MTSQRNAAAGDPMYFGRPHSQLANAQGLDIFKTTPSWCHPQLPNRDFALSYNSLRSPLHQLKWHFIPPTHLFRAILCFNVTPFNFLLDFPRIPFPRVYLLILYVFISCLCHSKCISMPSLLLSGDLFCQNLEYFPTLYKTPGLRVLDNRRKTPTYRGQT